MSIKLISLLKHMKSRRISPLVLTITVIGIYRVPPKFKALLSQVMKGKNSSDKFIPNSTTEAESCQRAGASRDQLKQMILEKWYGQVKENRVIIQDLS